MSAVLQFPPLRTLSGQAGPAVDEHVGEDAAGLAAFMDDATTVAIWTRREPALVEAAGRLAETDFCSEFALAIGTAWPGLLRREILTTGALDPAEAERLSSDVEQLVTLFDDLVGAPEIGLRMRALGHEMCPRFHVDRVPLRLLCTYAGPGTEWLCERDVDRRLLRAQLGEDRCDPAMRAGAVVRRAQPAHVGLFKGEAWPGREGLGAVHRSPSCAGGQRRLLLSLEVL